MRDYRDLPKLMEFLFTNYKVLPHKDLIIRMTSDYFGHINFKTNNPEKVISEMYSPYKGFMDLCEQFYDQRDLDV